MFKELRKKLGLTQQEMADYAGVPRSTYSLVEIGKRTFATGPFMKLGYLHVVTESDKFKKVSFETNEETENAKNEYRKTLEKRIDDCKYAQFTLERKKKDVLKDYVAAKELLKFTVVFFEIYPERKEVEPDVKWMNVMSSSAQLKHTKNKLILIELELDEHKLKCEMDKAMEMLAAIT